MRPPDNPLQVPSIQIQPSMLVSSPTDLTKLSNRGRFFTRNIQETSKEGAEETVRLRNSRSTIGIIHSYKNLASQLDP